MHENYNDVMMKSNHDGVERVLSDTDEYAFLMESASIDYEVQRNCELRQVGNPLDSKGYGIVMRKSKHISIINNTINYYKFYSLYLFIQ